MGNRLRQVSLSEASLEIRKIYQNFFGGRDPVAQPGTATGTRGDYWTTFALVPDILQMSRDSLFALVWPDRVLKPRFRELAISRTGIVGDSKFEYSPTSEGRLGSGNCGREASSDQGLDDFGQVRFG